MMTSNKFLRGPLRSFSTSTTSTSTTSTDQDDRDTTTTNSTSTSSSRNSSKRSGNPLVTSSPTSQQLQQSQRQPQRQQQQSPHVPYRGVPTGARDVKTAILDRFASFKPNTSRSQTWASRRLAAFFPGTPSPQLQSPTHDKPSRLPSGQAPTADDKSSIVRVQSSTTFEFSPSPASSQLSPKESRRSFDSRQQQTRQSQPTLSSPEEDSWHSRPRHNTIGHPPNSPNPTRVSLPLLQLQLPREGFAVPPPPSGPSPTRPGPRCEESREESDYPPRVSSLRSELISDGAVDPQPLTNTNNSLSLLGTPPPPPPTKPLPPPPIIREEEELSVRRVEDNDDIMLHMIGIHHQHTRQPHEPSMPLRKESLPTRKDSLPIPPAPPVPASAPPPVSSPQLSSGPPGSCDDSVASTTNLPRGRSASAQVSNPQASSLRGAVSSPRVVSNPTPMMDSRPSSSGSHVQNLHPSQASVDKDAKDVKESKKLSRRSWFPGRSRSNSIDQSQPTAPAWILDTNTEYNVSLLVNGEKIPELWTETGDVYVHLFPKDSNIGPSLKVPRMVISASVIFNELIQAEFVAQINRRNSSPRSRNFSRRLSIEDLNRSPSPPLLGESHLYIVDPPEFRPDPRDPLPDVERLVSIRNLFAFLMGQPLVATRKAPTFQDAFIQIAGLLEEFYFTSEDGSSFGEIVDMVFTLYLNQMGLQDLHNSDDKILQALALSEKMRCNELYNTAFAHAVGRCKELSDPDSPRWQSITTYTRQKIERGHFNLTKRLEGSYSKLEQFEFPSVFEGMANSRSNEELKKIRFDVWRNSFGRMRSFVLSYYRTELGSWPPKASNKKNHFSEGGLSRLVLKTLYSDMCAMYDLLVNRRDLTPRQLHGLPENIPMEGNGLITALRRLLSEFENSLSPTPPPVPFDVPMLPSMTSILETYNDLAPKEQLKFEKKIKDHELLIVLNKAYNYDINALNIRFLQAFKKFEHKEAKGKLASDLADQRIGYWLFMYVVLQSLPLLVVDAPGLKNVEDVEYFLCEAPWGNPPWAEDAGVRKMWYEVNGGAGIVELPADYIMFSTEAIYHRSHCWVAAKEWEHLGDPAHPAVHPAPPITENGGVMSPLAPPSHTFANSEAIPRGSTSSPQLGAGWNRTPSPALSSPQLVPPQSSSRNPSPDPGGNLSNNNHRSSIVLGFKPLTAPESLDILQQGRRGSGGNNYASLSARRSSSVNPSIYSRSRPMSRVASSGHLASMAINVDAPFEGHEGPESATSSDSPSATTGQTFDDILGAAPKKKKKRGFF